MRYIVIFTNYQHLPLPGHCNIYFKKCKSNPQNSLGDDQMSQNISKRVLVFAAVAALLWVTSRYLLPIGLPFLLGAGLALAAEPAVRLLSGRLRLPRGAATAIGVSGVFVLSLTVLLLLLTLLVRQLGNLSGILPQIVEAVQQGTAALQGWLLDLAARMPGGIGNVVSRLLDGLFGNGGSLLEQAAMQIPKMASALLGNLSQGMLGVATGIISGYMISVRLPALRRWAAAKLPENWRARYLPALQGLKKALGGWLLAELKLAGVTFLLLSVGFLLLQVSNSIVWAGLVTIVDAFPILGVGTVLVPWSIVCLLQGRYAQGIGLLGVFTVIWLVRSILEPKLVGKGLGLDPLVTLAAIYAGFRLWGITGMLLAPILALAVTQMVKQMKR